MPTPSYLHARRRPSAGSDRSPPVESIKAQLAEAIVSALREDCVAAIEVERLTGFAATYISRIRNGHLSRFTVDRLLCILICLGRRVDVTVARVELSGGAPGLSRAEAGHGQHN